MARTFHENVLLVENALQEYATRLDYEAAFFEYEGEMELVKEVLEEQDQLQRAYKPFFALLHEYPILAEALAHAIREY